jgi:hypothetical protein
MNDLQLALPLNVTSSPVSYKPKFPTYDSYWDEIVKDDVLTVEYIEEITTVSTNPPGNDELVLTVDYEEISTVSTDISEPFQLVLTVECESKINLSTVSKRSKGDGTGRIQWRTVYRSGKPFKQAWYDYQIHEDNGKVVSRTRYIPKRLISQVELLELEKAPVIKVLQLLGL